MIVKRISLDYYSFYWSWHPQGSLTVPKCLNVASSDGVRLSATVKSLEKSLTQVLLIDFTKLWSHVHVLPGLVDHLRGVEGGVGDVGDCGEPVLRQVLPALRVGHPGQGEFILQYSQYEKNDHYDYIVIITMARVSHHWWRRQDSIFCPPLLLIQRIKNTHCFIVFFRLPPGAETHYKHSFISWGLRNIKIWRWWRLWSSIWSRLCHHYQMKIVMIINVIKYVAALMLNL